MDGKKNRFVSIQKQRMKRGNNVRKNAARAARSRRVNALADACKQRCTRAQNGTLMEPLLLQYGVRIHASPLIRIYSHGIDLKASYTELGFHLPSLASTSELLVSFAADTPEHILVTYETKKVVYNQAPIRVNAGSKDWLVPISIPAMCKQADVNRVIVHVRFSDQRFTHLSFKARHE